MFVILVSSVQNFKSVYDLYMEKSYLS